MENLELAKMANEIRKGIIIGVHSAKCGHPGGSQMGERRGRAGRDGGELHADDRRGDARLRCDGDECRGELDLAHRREGRDGGLIVSALPRP